MHKPAITNMVRFYTVLLLNEKPYHGYELMQEIGKRLEKKISPGQMYPFLTSLEKNNLITAPATKGAREKNQFRLTRRGRIFVKENLHRFGGLIEIALSDNLTICVHCGCKVFSGGITQKVRGRKLKFCCHHCAGSYQLAHK